MVGIVSVCEGRAGSAPLAGTWTRSRVPLFSSVTMLTVPPASLTRSLMLTSPRPWPLRPAPTMSNPRPSSAMDQLGEVAGTEQPHLGTPGVGVRHHVAQALLGDPIQAQRGVGRGGLEVPVGAEGHRHPLMALDLGAMRRQRGDQAGVLEHARMQVVREVADVLGEPDRALLKRRHVARQIGAPAACRRPAA